MVKTFLNPPSSDDFGQPFTRTEGELLFDAPTAEGPWAVMTYRSWKLHRRSPDLGTGRGQKYAYSNRKYHLLEG